MQAQEFVAHDEQIREAERDEQAVQVFRDPAVADFCEPPQAFDDVERVLDF